MNIFICSSKHFYDRVPPIKEFLESKGHKITLPNSFEHPFKEEEIKKLSKEEHSKWKGEMLKLQGKKILANDALFVLNLDKNGKKNYIGGATFLEIFEAWKNEKKIFFYNPIPEGMIEDELMAFCPIVINGNLSEIE